ncbi:MAG: CAP domain-containing protein [Chloroflexota bacterium]|nr:CAP domain-containing protein [Chloroflexota bacterium]
MHTFTFRHGQRYRPLAVLTALIALLGIFAVPASAATESAIGSTTTYAARVVQLTNAERAKAHLPPLATNASLTSAAQNYAGVLSQDKCFAHTCGPQPDLKKRLESAGYTFSGYRGWSYGENIAEGYQTPEAVVAAWMASPPHRANILNSSYRDIGVGLVVRSGSRYGYYWVQDFGARNR